MPPSKLLQQLYALKGKEYQIHKNGLPDRARKNIALLCGLFEAASYDTRVEIISGAVREISLLFFWCSVK